jgi:succinoglycan biosynthesis transport protein ExoP
VLPINCKLAARANTPKPPPPTEDTHPDVIRLKSEIDGLEKELGAQNAYRDTKRELEQTRADLAAARQTHTEDYPDVVRLSRQVSQLEEKLKNAPQQSGNSGDAARSLTIRPIFKSRPAARPRRPSAPSLMAQQGQLRARLAELEQRSAATPMIERDYNALMSDSGERRERSMPRCSRSRWKRSSARIWKLNARANASR